MTATDAARRFLDSIADLDDPAIFISVVAPDDLLEAARAIDARADEAVPLRGTTFVVKDNIDVAGLPTTAGCPAFAYQPSRSATVVDQLVGLGALAVAKTNLDQFATGLVGTRSPHGTPRNPLDASLVPGGSSSGSAVAVARGLVTFALGTDTAGSGRVPAALCGIVGLKPTRGRLSCAGVVPAVQSMDCVSIFARDIELAERVMLAAEGPDERDPYSRTAGSARPPDRGPTRIGYFDPSVLSAVGCSDDIVEAQHDLLATARRFGWTTTAIAADAFFAAGDLLYRGPWLAERTTAVGDFIDANLEQVDPIVAGIIRRGRDVTIADVHVGNLRLAEAQRHVTGHFDHIDVLVVPTVPDIPTVGAVTADPIGVNDRLGRFTTFGNLLDLCAISIPWPAGHRSTSITIYAPAWCDPLVADVAKAFTAGVPGVSPDPHGDRFPLVVAGAHLLGQPLEHQLVDRGATYVRTTTTAPTYRMYALAGTSPAKPGLAHDATGRSIEVDVWDLPGHGFATFVAQIPAPLCIGSVELADGSRLPGFLCEPRALIEADDITAYGGWRNYVKMQHAAV